jgi:hypothetical protein
MKAYLRMLGVKLLLIPVVILWMIGVSLMMIPIGIIWLFSINGDAGDKLFEWCANLIDKYLYWAKIE